MTTLLLGKDGQVGWQLQRSLAPYGPLIACGRAECDLGDPEAIRRLAEEDEVGIVFCGKQTIDGDTAELASGLARCFADQSPQQFASHLFEILRSQPNACCGNELLDVALVELVAVGLADVVDEARLQRQDRSSCSRRSNPEPGRALRSSA